MNKISNISSLNFVLWSVFVLVLAKSLPVSNELSDFQSTTLWILIVGFIIAFTLAFGVGANDVANVFGTSVGAKVLTLRQACIIATIFETLGSVLIGYKVSDTVRKGILDVSLYNNTEKELMLGSLAALTGSSLWNLIATFLSLPISGTHSIVGATIGFTLCARGFQGVNWITFIKIGENDCKLLGAPIIPTKSTTPQGQLISKESYCLLCEWKCKECIKLMVFDTSANTVSSWFVSPLLSGGISVLLFLLVRTFILRGPNPVEAALFSLPFFYGFTIVVNVFSIVHDGPKVLYLDNLAWFVSLPISLFIGFMVGLFVLMFVVPKQRKKLEKFEADSTIIENSLELKNGNSQLTYVQNIEDEKYIMPTEPKCASTSYDFKQREANTNGISSEISTSKSSELSSDLEIPPAEVDENPKVSRLFSFLQVLTATFGSFAHGGNDVSNAIGPLIAIYSIYTEGSVAQKTETPVYILFYGGVGISVGLWVWGRRVIETIGENLTKVTPSSGFCIEIGAAFTVLMASKIGIPISTTHCKVGSVVFVGWLKSTKEGVDWGLFRNIVIAWLVTVPLTAAVSALLMFIFRVAFL